MTSYSQNNKRIAKNTMLLYFRMFLTMGISLYTSRVILNTLGVEDFGIYSIVGGVIVLFSFFNDAMTRSTQRFLNFEMGQSSNTENIRKVFCTSINAHICIMLIMILLAETIGLWFVNTQLNIPDDRMHAANWVYQFSILTFCIQIIRVPYNASIIAHERMSIYAFISIFEVILKLLIVFLLVFSPYDKLIIYSLLVTIVTLLIFFIYRFFCVKYFPTCKYSFIWDKLLFLKLINFSAWSVFGSAANVGSQQGINILLNIFHGVVINTAVGIANQVSQALYSFVSNFQTAFNPQLIKSYAANDNSYFLSLVFRTSKISYYLLFLISLPIIICCEFVLNVWLGEVPAYTTSFCQLMIIFTLIDALSAPLWTSVQAIGNIRNYQIIISLIILSNLPLSYFVLKQGLNPEYLFYIRILVNLISFIFRIFYLYKKIKFPAKKYLLNVVLVILIVSLLAIPIPVYINSFFEGWEGLIYTTISSLIISSTIIYFCGLNRNEKRFLLTIFFKQKGNEL